eukprot:5058335-Pyramimonas_sp.AAC.1
MDAASRFSSDLFEPARSHWLPRQQQARAQGFTLFVRVHSFFLPVKKSVAVGDGRKGSLLR